mgnify:CR=1 FL=1
MTDRQHHHDIPQHEPGAKLDSGKVRMDLVLSGFPRALYEVGEIATYGAEKYTRDGWRSVPDGFNRYTGALMRHLILEAAGEMHDNESGLTHAAHTCWNALARLELLILERDSVNVSVYLTNHNPIPAPGAPNE